ncbi:MAG: hypothetical protein KDE54_13395 [Caldilineaceae bacterium]|nr:hypothetical protein [Caldilineaceae bacterium]MCB0142096.1 hypothetical protein [Caldilineaceae bacterium]
MMLMVTLCAFALRAHHLDFQSFWSDEGISLLRSSQPLAQMLALMPVEHVPGYFVLLHFWLQLSGQSDFALRFLSLWPSVLGVVLAWRLALDLATPTANPVRSARPDRAKTDSLTALSAALLLAFSTFQIWYAQEARMYGWLMASALASHLCFWRIWTRPLSGLSCIGYIISTALTVYLHFHGFMVPFVQTLFALGWLALSGKRREFVIWALCGFVILLLFLPWLPRALGIFAFGGWRPGGDPWQIPWRYVAAYTVGDAMPTPWHNWLTWLYITLIGLGCLGWWLQRRAAGLFLITTALGPLLIVFLLALQNPDFHERYSIAVTGPLSVLIGGGVSMLARLADLTGFSKPVRPRRLKPRWAWALLVVLTAANGAAISRLYTDSSLHKPDFRGAAQQIMQQEQPGDLILVDGPDPQKVFLHYYTGRAAVFDLRDLATADGPHIDRTLTADTQGAGRVWELLYFHGPSTVQQWLAQRGWPTPPRDHNGIRITLYGWDGASDPVQEMGVNFNDQLRLERAAISQTTAQAGALLRVTTAWQVLQPPPDYKFSLRLLDAAGNVVQADDYVPQNWFAPTSMWPVGQPFVEQRGLLLPQALPGGPYRITLRLYDVTNGAAVETTAGADVVLGEVTVEE